MSYPDTQGKSIRLKINGYRCLIIKYITSRIPIILAENKKHPEFVSNCDDYSWNRAGNNVVEIVLIRELKELS